MPEFCGSCEIFALDVIWVLGGWKLMARWRCSNREGHEILPMARCLQWQVIVGPTSMDLCSKIKRSRWQ